MDQKNSENPTKTPVYDIDNSKYIRSRTIGDIRAEKEMKRFCAALKAFDNPAWVCKESWYKILYPSERDTKMYFRALSRELFDFISKIVNWIDKEYLEDEIDSYLGKFKKEDEE